jgi:hypothetical protein
MSSKACFGLIIIDLADLACFAYHPKTDSGHPWLLTTSFGFNQPLATDLDLLQDFLKPS